MQEPPESAVQFQTCVQIVGAGENLSLLFKVPCNTVQSSFCSKYHVTQFCPGQFTWHIKLWQAQKQMLLVSGPWFVHMLHMLAIQSMQRPWTVRITTPSKVRTTF